MDNFQRCLDILKVLGKSMRYWGRYIDEFAECFYSLSKDERHKLREDVPSEDRFNLMNQLMSYANREFSDASREEKRRIIFLCFVLIAFENFEFDYRENIIRMNNFFENTDINKDLRTEEWDRVKFLMSEKSLDYLKIYV